MTTIHGSAGTVKIGSDTLVEISDFSIEESAEFADDTPLGETARTSNATAMTSWSASINCMLDETDTTGQQTLTAGASVTFNAYTEGDTSTKYQYSGTLRITSRSISQPKDGIVTIAFSGQGSGALSRTQIT